MRPLATAPLLLVLAAACGAPALAAGPPPAAGDDATYRAEVEAFRLKRYVGLRSKTGWLTLVGLSWLTEGENAVGTSEKARVLLPAGKAPGLLGVVRLQKGAASFEAAPGQTVTVDGTPVTKVDLVPDTAGKPTVLAHGSLTFYLIKRGERLGVRVKDGEAEALRAFKGVETFPADPEWRLVARFEKQATPRKIAIPTILGTTDEEDSPGAVVFSVGGKSFRLDALEEDDELFLIFGDRTNAKETYGGGRFLYTKKPGPDGTVVVDFNRAVNPPCVFTPYATCPLPPPQNKLPLRVSAGEKVYGKH